MKYPFYFSFFLLFVFITAVCAQTVMFQELPGEKTKISLRFMKPSFDNVDDLTFFSGTFDLQANVPLNEKWNVVVSMPYSTFSDGDRTNLNSIGNVYIGAQPHSHIDSTHQTIGSFGLYLPTSPDNEDNPYILAWYTNWHELHRYAPNTLTVYANLANFYTTPGKLFYGFEVGPNIWIPTGSDTEGRETEFLIHYGVSGGIYINNVILNAELTGLFFLSADSDSFSDKFYHSLAFNVQYSGWPVQPQLFYKLYLEEDLSDRVNGVLGLGVTFEVE